jgi:TolA-binding protein
VKSRKNWIFIFFSWLLITGIIWTHGQFQAYFASRPEALFEVERLQGEIQRIEKEKSRIVYQFEDFRQNAALHWPEARKNSYRFPASESFDLSSTQYERGRVLFKKGSLVEALQQFELLVEEYPYSKWINESFYYRCEILFQMRDFKKFTTCATQMTELFPESALTGFQLLRLAQIHEIHGQEEEASEIYRIVANQFGRDKTLASQAQDSLERIGGQR